MLSMCVFNVTDYHTQNVPLGVPLGDFGGEAGGRGFMETLNSPHPFFPSIHVILNNIIWDLESTSVKNQKSVKDIV